MPVISSKHLIPGDVVFKCKPLMVWIDYKYKGKHCDNCLKLTDQLKRCAKCLQMYYCDRNCQTIDWTFHKNECKVFREKTINEFDALFMAFLRLYLRINSDNTFATKRHVLFDGSHVCLNDIDIHVSHIPRKKLAMIEIFLQHLKSLGFIIGIDFKVTELLQWFKLVFVSTFKLERNTDNAIDFAQSISGALCLEVLPISHSCSPNMAFVRKDGLMEIRAIKPIAMGEELTMTWIELFMDCEERPERLKAGLNMFGYNCNKCKLHLDKVIDFQEFEQLLDKETKHWNSSKLGILHAYEMDPKFIQYLEAIYGEFHPSVTYFLLESFMCFANSKEASDSLLRLWFKRIERHVLVTHGSDHPWYAMLRKQFNKSLKI